MSSKRTATTSVARDLADAIAAAGDLGFNVHFRRISPLRLELFGPFDPIGDVGSLSLHTSGDRSYYLAIGVGIDLAARLGWGVPFASNYYMNETGYRTAALAVASEVAP